MKKVKYGRNSTGCYCYLYSRCWLGFFILDTIWGTGSCDVKRAENQAAEWQDQYTIPESLIIRKDI